MPSWSYDAPNGHFWRRFVVPLVKELCGVQDRLWNSEPFIVFHIVILHQARHVTASQAIQRRIDKRMDAWEEGRHGILVEETLRTCAQYLTADHREESKEHRANTYHILVLQGKLLKMVRCITEQETGSVIQTKYLCTKTGEMAMEVLRTKHPDARPPTAVSLYMYPDCTL